MTEDLYDNCRLLSIVTKPLWDWYTKQLKETKHPRAALQYSIQMAQNWIKDEHIRQMADLLISVHTFEWCSTRGTLNVAKSDELGLPSYELGVVVFFTIQPST